MQLSVRLNNRDKLTYSFIGLLLLGLFASTLVAYQHVKTWQSIAVRDELRLKANLAATDISRWVTAAKDRVEHLAEWLATTPTPLRDEQAWRAYIDSLPVSEQRPFLGFALDSDGFYLANQWAVPQDYDPRLRPWYREGKLAMTTAVTNPYLNVEADPWMEVAIVAPIIRNGRFIGLAGDHIPLDEVTQTITRMDMGHDGYGFLVDRQNRIIVHQDPNKIDQDWLEQDSLQPVADLDGGIRPMRLMESADFLYYVTDGGGQLGWSLILAVPKANIKLTLLKESALMLSHFLLVFCLVMVGFYLSNRHVLTPLIDYMELDSVTLLPNKKHFKQQLKDEYLPTNQPGKLLVITLDNYSRITATYPAAQVHLLQNQIKQRIQSLLSEKSLLGVFSESRYISYSYTDEADSGGTDLLARLSESLSEGYKIGGREVNCSFRIGAANFPEHGVDVEMLIDNAFSALANLNRQQECNYSTFRPAINQQFSDELKILSAMKTALRAGEFHMVYQPQYDVISGRMLGVESLIRWHSTELGRMVSPAEFIPVAESSELVVAIGDYVIEAVLSQLQQWRQADVDVGRVSINMSPRQLLSVDFYDRLMAAIDRFQVPTGLVELEITETSVLENPVESIVLLHRLKAAGFSIAIDDFGTGYSSLEYLNRMPIDKLKIDRSFIVDLDKQEKSGVIVQMIIAMANSLNLNVIAEGVETRGEARELCNLGCRAIQGYLFAKPMKPDALETFIQALPLKPGLQLSEFDRRQGGERRRLATNCRRA